MADHNLSLALITKKAIFLFSGMALALIPLYLWKGESFHSLSFFQNTVGQVRFVTNTNATQPLPASIQRWDTITDKQWLLKDTPESEQTFSIIVTFSQSDHETLIANDTAVVGYEIASVNKVGRLTTEGTNSYTATIDATNFPIGEHAITTYVSIDGTTTYSKEVLVHVSYPLYVTWTIDWEGYDMPNQNLENMAAIADQYDIPMTHFFNPRLYTSPDISKDRQQYFTNWVLNRKATHGDSIGLHLHMQPDFVEATGVTPIEDPETWGTSLTDGYDILVSNYDYTDMRKMLNWSIQAFRNHGLGTPTMFRAGGWFADEETLQAVNDTGFLLDSSGRTLYSFGKNKVVGHWSLETTTQPYQMNRDDQNEQNNPTMNLWQFPNNGADSWAFSTVDMIKRFEDNYTSTELTERRLVTYLSHPEWFDTDKPKMEALFSHLDDFTYAKDSGPVVYVTLEDAYNIWSN